MQPFNTYKEREKEGRRAHGDTVLLEDKQILIRFHRNSVTGTPKLRIETKEPHTQHKDKNVQLEKKRRKIPQPPAIGPHRS